jgi:hypothetical protein
MPPIICGGQAWGYLMRRMKFPALSSAFVYGRLGNGNEGFAGEAPPIEVRAKSSPGATK